MTSLLKHFLDLIYTLMLLHNINKKDIFFFLQIGECAKIKKWSDSL